VKRGLAWLVAVRISVNGHGMIPSRIVSRRAGHANSPPQLGRP
jgi:hypothetical protein